MAVCRIIIASNPEIRNYAVSEVTSKHSCSTSFTRTTWLPPSWFINLALIISCSVYMSQSGSFDLPWTGTCLDGWTDGWTNGWMDGWIDGRMDGYTDGQMDRWIDGQIDRWIDG